MNERERGYRQGVAEAAAVLDQLYQQCDRRRTLAGDLRNDVLGAIAATVFEAAETIRTLRPEPANAGE